MMLIPTLALFVSSVIAPWWVVAVCAWWLSLFRHSLPLLIALGFIIDRWYGYPLEALASFQYPYTAAFMLMGLTAVFIRSRLME